MLRPSAPRIELSRRELFQRTGTGVGAVALASLLAEDTAGATEKSAEPLQPRTTDFVPRAKNVIFLHLVGAPSHLDLFDYKPELVRLDGQPMPDHLWEGLRLAFIRKKPNLLGTRFQFDRHGKSGLELSELLPNLATVADELCLLKGLHTEHFNHAPAQLFFQTGFPRFGRPSLGAWSTYGLGSENANLPGFVVLITGNVAGAGNSLWGSGFLPSVYPRLLPWSERFVGSEVVKPKEHPFG